jgi:WD40 repeat protein
VDPATGEALLKLSTSSRALAFGQLRKGPTILASGGDDGTVRLWDPATSRTINTLSGHRGPVRSLAFAQLPISQLIWSRGRGLLASGGDDGTVRLWHLATGKEISTLSRHSEPVRALAFGQLTELSFILASGSDDGVVRLWELRRFPRSPDKESYSFDHRWRPLAGEATLRGLPEGRGIYGREILVIYQPSPVLSLAWDHPGASGRGGHLAMGLNDGAIAFEHLWNSDQKLSTILALREGSAAISSDNRYRLTGDANARFWWSINLCRFDPDELEGYHGIQRVASLK